MRKVLSLVLACVLVLGLSTSAFATLSSYDGVYPVIGQSATTTTSGGSKIWIANFGPMAMGTVYPDHTEYLHIYWATNGSGNGFENGTVKLGDHDANTNWSVVRNEYTRTDGTKYYTPTYADRADVRNQRYDVKVQVAEGSRVIDGVSLVYSSNAARIKVKWIDPFVSVDDIDFDFNVYLTEDRSRKDSYDRYYNGPASYQYYGTFQNYEQDVHGKDDLVYTYDIPVVEAIEYVKEIEVNMGYGIALFTRMFEGRKYYAQADQDPSSADLDILDKYPAIDTVYNLYTINLSNTANYVLIDDPERLFVYDKDLRYVGTTNDKLPYSTKYYVATSELDVADDSVIDSIPSGDTENVPSGGDEVPENVNRNPGTGC